MLLLRRNLLLALGIMAMLSGAALSAWWLQRQTGAGGPGANGAPVPVSVLAAAHALVTGALLRPEDVVSIELAPGGMKAGYIAGAAESEYAGALVRRDFAAGEPLAADGLLKPSDRDFLSATLAPGMRALTLPVEAQQTASGLVRPGDHVDVVMTQSLGADASDAGRRAVAETVLSDVRVVAVEQSLTPEPKPLLSDTRFAQELRPPRTITLETSESDAQKILVAGQLGKIDLAVRALVASATKGEPVAPTWAADVSPAIKGAAPKTPAPPAAPAPAAQVPVRSTIEVMHGGKIELR